MWNSLTAPWQACLEEAWTACCAGCVPIGAVVTDSAGVILARGRNRIFQIEAETGMVSGQMLAHAELNALIRLPAEGLDRHTCALYSTMEPCPLCLGALYMSGVRRLHYACRDPYAGSVDLLGATPYLRRKPIQVFGPESLALETILSALHTEFALEFEPSEMSRLLLEVWRESMPEGVALGKALFEAGVLRRMRERGVGAGEAFDVLVKKYFSSIVN
jgi:tRNA(Arg) A34 adenosine deaminase TadA